MAGGDERVVGGLDHRVPGEDQGDHQALPEHPAQAALEVVAGPDADGRRIEPDEEQPIAERRQVGQRLDRLPVDLERRPMRPGTGAVGEGLELVGHQPSLPGPGEPIAQAVFGGDVRLARRDASSFRRRLRIVIRNRWTSAL